MEIFATICLAVLIIAMYYFGAWTIFRVKSVPGDEKDRAEVLAVVVNILIGFLSCFLLPLLAHWIVKVGG